MAVVGLAGPSMAGSRRWLLQTDSQRSLASFCFLGVARHIPRPKVLMARVSGLEEAFESKRVANYSPICCRVYSI